MKWLEKEEHIELQFKREELTGNIEAVFSASEAKIDRERGIVKIRYEAVADLNIHEVKKLGLPPIYPHRMEIKTKGRPITSAFFAKVEFIGPQSRKFYQKSRTKKGSPILTLDGQQFTLTNPQFAFLEKLEELSPGLISIKDKNAETARGGQNLKNPGERLKLWTELIKSIPQEARFDNSNLLDIHFIRADRFCLDQIETNQNSLSGNDFQIVPELIYKYPSQEEESAQMDKTNGAEERRTVSQLPQGISLDFKKQFLCAKGIDPYYKAGSYYIQLSEPLKECLKIIKKVNSEPLEKRRAFYLNPMVRIEKEMMDSSLSARLKKSLDEILKEIFFETDQFESDRISHLGKWEPKMSVYIDPDSKNPWFPKDDIAIEIKDSLFHFNPDDMDSIINGLEEKKTKGEKVYIYKKQAIPSDEEVIAEFKRVRRQIIREAKKIKPQSEGLQKEEKLPSVAIIKDNIDQMEYQSALKKRPALELFVPQELEDKLNKYPHQKKGLLWLQKSFIEGAPGSLLADDMGLGKTFQTLAFLYWRKKNMKDKKPFLVVAPTGLLKNWQEESQKHLRQYGGLGREYLAYGESFRRDRKSKTPKLIRNDMEASDWVLASYESVRDHHKNFFIKISWDVVVFDEIQKIKNPNSLMTNASKALDSDFSIGLTGTPIENSFIDLWCISDCLEPKILGLLKDFHRKYIKEPDKKQSASWEIKSQLSKRSPPFMMRRLKESILKDLPKREIIQEKISMTEEQKEAYSEVMRKAENREFANSFQALTLLKRYSIYLQDCFEGSDEEFIQSSAKLKFLFKTLEEIKSRGEKALICAENRNLQKKLKGICAARWSLEAHVINGETPGDRRKKTVEHFSDFEGFNVMFISPKAGGVGLNIVSANHIIHLERWWNPAVEDQANDRIFRIGQRRPVFVYYPLAVHPDYNSFDIILNDLLNKKRGMRSETLIPSEPNKNERNEFYRDVTGNEPYNTDSFGSGNSFYMRKEWKAVRQTALQKYPPICMRCGSKKDIEVDHVKPRCKHRELELDPDNLQILCRYCNHLKGAKCSSEWDFRKQTDSV